MKILVTGSLGNIGKNIIEYLYKNNHQIIGLDNRNSQEKLKYPLHVCDLRDRKGLEQVFMKIGKIDVVLHLAALISYESHEAVNLIESNTFATYNLGFLSNAYDVDKFIYLSSIPITESAESALDENNFTDEPKTTYHFSKLMGEKILFDPSFNLKPIIIRIPSPIFKGMNKNLFFPKIVTKAIFDEPIDIYGKGSRVQNYIHVTDIAIAIEKAMLNNVKGLYFIGGTSISNLELVKYVLKYTKSSSSISIIEDTENSDDEVRWYISNKKAYNDFEYRPMYNIDSMIDLFYKEDKQKWR